MAGAGSRGRGADRLFGGGGAGGGGWGGIFVGCASALAGLVSGVRGAALWASGSAGVPARRAVGGPDCPGRIAAVTTIGYGGFLVGPPLIGLLADQVGLGRALLVLLVLAGGIAALAPAVRSRRAQPVPAS